MDIRVHCRCALNEEIRLIQIFIIYHFVYIPLHRHTSSNIGAAITTIFFFVPIHSGNSCASLCAHSLIIPLQIT